MTRDKAITAPATAEAASWDGWGTALKPAHEPIVLARKPLSGTVVGNVLEHGTGALNIDGCRVNPGEPIRCGGNGHGNVGGIMGPKTGVRPRVEPHDAGRWPPNVLLSHLPLLDDDGNVTGDACADGCVPGCPVAELDAQSGVSKSSGGSGEASRRTALGGDVYGDYSHSTLGRNAGGLGDSGGASRFFPVFRYEPKAPARERPRLEDGTAHPTVKPLALMRWLVRLVTPPGGLVLDPFAGTGTTGEACQLEGFRAVLVERSPEYADLAVMRLGKPSQPGLFGACQVPERFSEPTLESS